MIKYYKKIITCGNHLILKEYDKPIKYQYVSKRMCYEKNDLPTKDINISKNLYRLRNNMKMLIDTNVNHYSKFITLTYANTELDRDKVLDDFKKFKKRFKYHYGEDIKYIGVLEHQKKRGEKEENEGCYHIHIVLFNAFKIDFKTFDKDIWQLGSCNTKKIDTTENIGRYLMKYITKEYLFGKNKKNILRSHNLNMPNENILVSNELLDSIKDDATKYKKTFEKTYKCYSNELNNETGEVIKCDNLCLHTEFIKIDKQSN